MEKKSLKKMMLSLTMIISGMHVMPAFAEGGISIQGTRIIYPINAKQESLSVRNSSPEDAFLVQSWVESADGQKSHDFVVTPPLYLSGPKNENTLRLMRVAGQLPKDRESLYYFVSKAIPSIDDEGGSSKNVLRIAASTRIKLFVRPAGLTPAAKDAPSYLSFQRVGGEVKIINPTPYYITLTDIKVGGRSLKDIMVAPKASAQERLPASGSSELTFHTLNDYGAITTKQSGTIK